VKELAGVERGLVERAPRGANGDPKRDPGVCDLFQGSKT
jgi:hypothetical protein